MPVTHTYVDPIPDRPADAAAGKVLPSHWNAVHTVTDLANSSLATMPAATIKGNNTAGASVPLDLTTAQVRTMLSIVDGVSSVTAANASLTISPTTGAVQANINLGNTNTWTVPQGILGSAPLWKIETTSTSASLADVGAYYASYNTTGLIGAVGAHTSGYSNPGTIFGANQYTLESYGTTGTVVAAWGTGGDIAFAVMNGGATALPARMTVKSTGTVLFGAGSTAAGSAPVKFTSGALMSSAEAGAVEFLTDKFYGTITTGTARKELTLNDAGLTSGRVPVVTTNGRLTDNASFQWDNGNARLNIGGPTSTAGNDFYLQKTVAGQVGGFVQNLSTNAAAYAISGVYNSATGIDVVYTSTGFTTAGLVVANQAALSSGGAGGLLVKTTTTSDVIVCTNGSATTNERFRCDTNGNVTIGNAALATNATNGHFYIPTCAGTPTGVPTTKTGRCAIIMDTTNHKLYVYDGSWVVMN